MRCKRNSALCAASAAAELTQNGAARRAVSVVQLESVPMPTDVPMQTDVRTRAEGRRRADPKLVPAPIVAEPKAADQKREAPRVENPSDAVQTHVVPNDGRVVKAVSRMHAVPKVVLVRMVVRVVKVAVPTRVAPKAVDQMLVVHKIVVPVVAVFRVVRLAGQDLVVFLTARLAGPDLVVPREDSPGVKARHLELRPIAPNWKV